MIIVSLSTLSTKPVQEKYQTEQSNLGDEVSSLQSVVDDTKGTEEGARSWIAHIRDFKDLAELTPEVLNELIERIDIHDRECVDGT